MTTTTQESFYDKMIVVSPVAETAPVQAEPANENNPTIFWFDDNGTQHIDLTQLQNNDQLMLPLTQLQVFTLGNVRKARNEKAYRDLVQDVKINGVIQPIAVRVIDHRSAEILAGEGRWLASMDNNLTSIPVIIKAVNDQQAIAINLSENLNREGVSILEQAESAQRYVTLFEGDRNAAAAELGWSRAKLDKRLELLKCSDKIKAYLDQGLINVEVALILSSFPSDRQDATADTCVAEKWTAAYARSRVAKAQMPLDKAIFDATDCAACEHNTGLQNELMTDLFGEATPSLCSNRKCYKDKTFAALEVKKAVVEQKYGKVLFWSEVSQDDSNQISAELMGEQQFSQGCSGCLSNVCVLDDRLGVEGQTYTNTCIDKACFIKLTTPEQTVELDDELTEAATNTTAPVDGKKASKKAATNKPVVQKTPQKILDFHRGLLRKAAACFSDQPLYMLSLSVASLCNATGFKPSIEGYPKDFNAQVVYGLSLPLEQLQQTSLQAVAWLLNNEEDGSHCHVKRNTIDLAIDLLKTRDDAEQLAKAQWQPTIETLKMYNQADIVTFAEQSGFAAAMMKSIGEKGQATWDKAAKGKKGDLVQLLAKTDFDWSDFAPASMLALLKK